MDKWDWVIVILTALIVIGSLVGLALELWESPDSAGLQHTDLPFRKYRVDGHPVWAFELYGLKCVAVEVGLDCTEMGR